MWLGLAAGSVAGSVAGTIGFAVGTVGTTIGKECITERYMIKTKRLHLG